MAASASTTPGGGAVPPFPITPLDAAALPLLEYLLADYLSFEGSLAALTRHGRRLIAESEAAYERLVDLCDLLQHGLRYDAPPNLIAGYARHLYDYLAAEEPGERQVARGAVEGFIAAWPQEVALRRDLLAALWAQPDPDLSDLVPNGA